MKNKTKLCRLIKCKYTGKYVTVKYKCTLNNYVQVVSIWYKVNIKPYNIIAYTINNT